MAPGKAPNPATGRAGSPSHKHIIARLGQDVKGVGSKMST